VLEPCLSVWGGDCMVEFLCINAKGLCTPYPSLKLEKHVLKKAPNFLLKTPCNFACLVHRSHAKRHETFLMYCFTKANTF
jgi:hypothetical protein